MKHEPNVPFFKKNTLTFLSNKENLKYKEV